MIVWGAPLPITGEGLFIRAGTWARWHATVIPDYLSKSGSIPARYFKLGVIGQAYDGFRDEGVRVLYSSQEFTRFDESSDSIYWVLENGVSGELYQGVEVSGQPAFGCILESDTTQVIPDNVDTAQVWNVEVYDPWGMYDHAGSPGVIHIVAPGTYLIRAGIYWGANGAGLRLYSVRKNGTDIVAQLRAPPPGGSEFTQIVLWSGNLGVGDTLEVIAYQNSGGSITTYNGLGSFVAECWRLSDS